MRWFKHDVDMIFDLKIQAIVKKHGAYGYAIFCLCLEMVGREGKNNRIEGSLEWPSMLSHSLFEKSEVKIRSVIKDFASLGLIDRKSFSKGDLHIPKMSSRIDEYTRKKLRSMSGQNPVNVRTKSDIDKIRIDKRREEEIRRDGQAGFSSLSDLSKNDPSIKATLEKMGLLKDKGVAV